MKEEYKSSQVKPQKSQFPSYTGAATTHSQGIYGYGSKKTSKTTIVGAALSGVGFIFSLCIPFLGIIFSVLGVMIALVSYGTTVKENRPGKELLIGSIVVGAIGIFIAVVKTILAVILASSIG